MPDVPDVARVRLTNALHLFDEFVQATVRSADAATLRGLERRFAERLLIQPSYWSQIKAGSRQIGERLARQFERQCKKPVGWLDQDNARSLGAGASSTAHVPPAALGPGGRAVPGLDAPDNLPQDDDERFIMGLVLTYYRRHPARARQRLLDLLGEVLQAPPERLAPRATASAGPPPTKASVRPAPAASAGPSAPSAPSQRDDQALWSRVQAGVAPLKRKP